MLPDTEAGRSLIPLVKSFVAHHRGAEPGNLRPVFIVKQQICVCFFLSNALWHSTAPAGLGHTWMMPQSKRPWRWGRALGELLLGSWTSLGEGERKKRRRRRRGKAATALLSSAGSSWVRAHEQAGAKGGRASPRHSAPGTAPSPAAHGARARQTLPGVGQQLPCGHLLTRKGVCFCFAAKARGVWLQVCTSPPPARVYIALIRLHFCF